MRWCLQNLERTLNISFSAIKNANPWCQASPSAEKCKIRVIPLRYQRIISLPRHSLPRRALPSSPCSLILAALSSPRWALPSLPRPPLLSVLTVLPSLCSAPLSRCAVLSLRSPSLVALLSPACSALASSQSHFLLVAFSS